METSFEYDVTLLKLYDLKVILEREWEGTCLRIEHVLNRSAPSGVYHMPRNLSSYSIGRICLIKVVAILDSSDDSKNLELKLFYGGNHQIIGDTIPKIGYSNTNQVLYEFLAKLIILAPDRLGDNKIGKALEALR